MFCRTRVIINEYNCSKTTFLYSYAYFIHAHRIFEKATFPNGLHFPMNHTLLFVFYLICTLKLDQMIKSHLFIHALHIKLWLPQWKIVWVLQLSSYTNLGLFCSKYPSGNWLNFHRCFITFLRTWLLIHTHIIK
jgi:hypothetical protein